MSDRRKGKRAIPRWRRRMAKIGLSVPEHIVTILKGWSWKFAQAAKKPSLIALLARSEKMSFMSESGAWPVSRRLWVIFASTRDPFLEDFLELLLFGRAPPVPAADSEPFGNVFAGSRSESFCNKASA